MFASVDADTGAVGAVGFEFTVTVPEIVAAVHGDVCPLVVIV